MADELGHRVAAREGDVGRLEPPDDRRRTHPREDSRDDCVQFLAVADATGIRREAGIGRKGGPLDDGLAETRPFPRVLDGQEDLDAILADEKLVGGNRRMPGWTARDEAELDRAIDAAIACNGPSLIEARIDRSNYGATLRAIRG